MRTGPKVRFSVRRNLPRTGLNRTSATLCITRPGQWQPRLRPWYRRTSAPFRPAIPGIALHCPLHVPREARLPYEWQEPFPAEDEAKELLGFDEATLRSALLGPKLVVFVPKPGVGKRLVRDRN